MAPPAQYRMADRLADRPRIDQVQAWRRAVASEVRALMGRFQVSQTALGPAIGVSQPGLSRRLKGDIPFDVDDLYAIALYFDVAVTSLFPEKGTASVGPDAA